jgi:hypothetical protein
VKKRIWIVLLVISLGINIGFLLHWFWPKIVSGRPAGSDKAQFGWHTSPMRHGFGLNAKQARLMENERRQVLARAKPLQDELHLKRRELFILLKSKTVADAELDVALNEISRLQILIEKMFILHSLKVKGFFTPVQLQKYEGFFERGLCPGMMSKESCPPQGMTGSMKPSGCRNQEKIKK